MNANASSTVWLQLLTLLAIEAGLVALVLAVLQRYSRSGAWRRTLCQAAIAGTVLLAVCELSGVGREIVDWTANGIRELRVDARAGDRARELTELNKLNKLNGLNGSENFEQPLVRADASPVLDTPDPDHGTDIVDDASSRGRQSAHYSVPEVQHGVTSAASSPWTESQRGLTSAATIPRTAETSSGIAHPTRSANAQAAGSARANLTVAANDSEETLVLAILLVWVAGLVLAGARACIARCLFILFRSRRRLVTDEALLLRVSELARGLRFSRRVRLIESGRLASPIAFGLLRPTIGLPRDFVARFDPEKRDVMLAHELAHLASHDPFWCLLADAASALLWWHPCVWWMRRQLHLASELAADEASLLVVDGPRVLAECLVELGGQLAGPRLVAPLGISGFRSNLGCRVQRLIHLEGRNWSPPRTAYSLLVRCLGAPALVAMGLLCTAWIAPNDLMKGDGMNTIRQNWKRSLAMLALLGTVNAQTAEPAGGPAAPTAKASDPTAPIASSGQHRTVRIFPLGHALAAEVKGKVQSKLSESDTVLADDRSNAIVVVVENDELEKIAELIQQLDAAESAPAASPENALRRRYALVGVEQDWRGPAREPAGTENQPSPLEKKLREIVLSEVSFDGLPLGEVLRYLNDQALKQDKNKTGINFLVSQNGNSAPPQPGMIDPATGLPVASGSEAFDVSQVAIKFSLPLKHVTLKNVLDAIVKVADEPIEYTVEDYAVVFSPRAGPVSGWRRKAAAYGAPAGQAQFPGAAAGPVLLSIDPATGLSGSTEGVPVRGPGGFNIDFGVWRPEPSKQVGPAAAGKPGDFWNTVGVPNADHHTESGMRFASGEPSAIQVEMFNLGGGWGNSGLMGVKDPMLDTFNYPVNNQGGNSQVILHQVPPGKYDVYIYGHGAKSAGYYGDYTLSVGSHKYGRKTTTHGMDAERNTKWVEGSQYVKFSGVKVGPDEKVEILIQPGAQVSDESGRTFADAMICGLQLIPKN